MIQTLFVIIVLIDNQCVHLHTFHLLDFIHLNFQRILIPRRHTLTLLPMHIHPTHMAPFSVNITRTVKNEYD